MKFCKNFIFCFVFFIPLSVFSHEGGSDKALQRLFKNGHLKLRDSKECEPFIPRRIASDPKVSSNQAKSTDKNAELTLADDIALSLDSMAHGPVLIDSSCEKLDDSKQWCRVVFTLNRGENNWSRIYMYESSRNGLSKIQCVNVP